MAGDESDLTVAVAKPKEGGGSSSIICPMLTATNYTFWAMRMRMALRVHKVWDVVEKETIPHIPDGEKNDMAIALICQSIPEALVLQVGELDSAKKIWNTIQAKYVGAERVREARLQTLMSEFERLTMKDSESIDDFSGKLSEISSKTAALGTTIEEISSKTAEASQEISHNFEDIVGRLKAYEERIAEREGAQEEQNKLMYANMEAKQDKETGGGGRGQGGKFTPRGRGRRRYGGRNISEITCFRCDQLGHFASHCPDRLLKLQEAQEAEKQDTEEADKLMMYEVPDILSVQVCLKLARHAVLLIQINYLMHH
ncbi:unnamed protein product [Microthlaspi erraticum]|uniref:CCHC-type domain-containing protein n=1 Tax=Microthlaspi erraticum TaxID=1685480 RepID=A0A6D2KRU3_9BRAS|nr:unnamed protein product [Microthlaspi erraticum]